MVCITGALPELWVYPILQNVVLCYNISTSTQEGLLINQCIESGKLETGKTLQWQTWDAPWVGFGTCGSNSIQTSFAFSLRAPPIV